MEAISVSRSLLTQAPRILGYVIDPPAALAPATLPCLIALVPSCETLGLPVIAFTHSMQSPAANTPLMLVSMRSSTLISLVSPSSTPIRWASSVLPRTPVAMTSMSALTSCWPARAAFTWSSPRISDIPVPRMKRIPSLSSFSWTSTANSGSNMPSRICGRSSMTVTSSPRRLNATAISKPTSLAPITAADLAVLQFLRIFLPSSSVLTPYTSGKVCPGTGIMKEFAPVASINES